jgi:hypothetical protein
VLDVLKYTALLLLAALAVLATRRVVIAEKEAGDGSVGPVRRSTRVVQLDRPLVVCAALAVVALIAYFTVGMN